MEGLRPDTTGLEAIRNQPEFTQKLWQYLNRVTTDWKIAAGQEKAKQFAFTTRSVSPPAVFPAQGEISPADGYPGVGLLARLRKGS
jgi:hypothetical protein